MKHIFGIELNHQNAPLKIRERAALDNDQVKAALHLLKKQLSEVVIIATCNRLSVYAYAEKEDIIIDWFNQFGELQNYLSVYKNEIAFKKLFATAAGIESQAIGEHQILGQIRQAYLLAQKEDATGAIFNGLFRTAIHVGKRVRGETSIGQYSTSLAAVSYDLMKDKYKDLSTINIMVIGTGDIAQLLLKMIGKGEVGKLFIASRDEVRAKETAESWNAIPISYEQINDTLPNVDVVFGGAGVNTQVLEYHAVHDVVKKDLLLIDLGLPRNFDNKLKEVEKITLYDLDDIKFYTQESFQKRMSEIPKAETIIHDELEEFLIWLNIRKNASPLISSYWQQLEDIKEEELKWALPKLGEIDKQQTKTVKRLVHRIIRKISKQPIEQMRHYAQYNAPHEHPSETIRKVFDIKDTEQQ